MMSYMCISWILNLWRARKIIYNKMTPIQSQILGVQWTSYMKMRRRKSGFVTLSNQSHCSCYFFEQVRKEKYILDCYHRQHLFLCWRPSKWENKKACAPYCCLSLFLTNIYTLYYMYNTILICILVHKV